MFKRALILTALLATVGTISEAQLRSGLFSVDAGKVFRSGKRIASLPEGTPQLVASDREAAYVVIRPTGSPEAKLYAISAEGTTLLATRLAAVRDLRVEGAFVYWTSERGKERVTKDGWEREVVEPVMGE